MRRAERLFRLVNELRAQDVVRGAELAERLEISTRTLYRDIAHLQGSGLPIEGEAGVGYMLRAGFDLPNITLTHDQIDALAVGLSYVEQSGDAVLSTAAREVRAKMQAALPDNAQRSLADAPFLSLDSPGHEAHGDITLIRQAIRERRILRLAYRTPNHAVTSRNVRPLVVWKLARGWMVSGWCELREDFRSFRVDRMEEVHLSSETFTDDPGKSKAAYIAYEHANDTRDQS